jgi:5'-nucleotidase
MVTNDDGVQSSGLQKLADAISKYAEVTVVAPDQPQSAAAMSLTFHKPLRISKVLVGNRQCYALSGSPADSTMVGVNKIMRRRPDLVASGINFGDNVTFQDVLASGTVAAALEAALMGIPSAAFSMEVPEETIFAPAHPDIDFSPAALVAGEIIHDILEKGMPRGTEILNVNFPSQINAATKIMVTSIARRKYKDVVLQRADPRGRPYYWLWGQRLTEFKPDTDANAVHEERAISISPIAVNMSAKRTSQVEQLAKRVHKRITRIAFRKFGRDE